MDAIREFQELRNQQHYEFICGRLGHSWAFILPLRTRSETREVRSICKCCRTEGWSSALSAEAYARLLKDEADGKLKLMAQEV